MLTNPDHRSCDQAIVDKFQQLWIKFWLYLRFLFTYSYFCTESINGTGTGTCLNGTDTGRRRDVSKLGKLTGRLREVLRDAAH